jgi:hypothetical protein
MASERKRELKRQRKRLKERKKALIREGKLPKRHGRQ